MGHKIQLSHTLYNFLFPALTLLGRGLSNLTFPIYEPWLKKLTSDFWQRETLLIEIFRHVQFVTLGGLMEKKLPFHWTEFLWMCQLIIIPNIQLCLWYLWVMYPAIDIQNWYKYFPFQSATFIVITQQFIPIIFL